MSGRLAMYVLFCFPVPRLQRPGDGGDSRMGVSDAGELHDGNPPAMQSGTVYDPAPAAHQMGGGAGKRAVARQSRAK